MSKFTQLPPACWWLAASTLINRMGAMVFPFLVLYFNKGLNISLETAASIAACWGLGSFAAGPLGGWACDRLDPIRLLAATMLATGILMLSFPFIHSLAWLAPATFCLALMADIGRPCTMTALARLAGGEHGRDAFALNYTAINLGMSIGPTLGGYLAEVDYRFIFWVDGGSSLTAATLLLLSGIVCPKASQTSTTKTDWNIGPRALKMYLWLSFFFWSFMTFFTAAPVYAVKWLHYSERAVGYIWMFNTLLIVCTNLWVTRLTASISLPRLLACGCAFQALCYLNLWLIPGLKGLILATLWLSIGEMLVFSNANAYIAQVVAPQKIGRAMGLHSLCVSLALITSAPTMGYFFQHHNPNWLWAVAASAASLACMGMIVLPKPDTCLKQ